MSAPAREWSQRLEGARLCLLFTPDLCLHHDPLELLDATLGSVDLLQLRIKGLGAASDARALFEWGQRLLAHLSQRTGSAPPLVINDRLDVARCLMDAGLAGVHLGQNDAPPALARQCLGPGALVGLSTHSAAEVVEADATLVDYLGFGPVHPSNTKGYTQGLGAQAAWIAANGSALPVFPIGGIDEFNAAELAPIGRAAVSSAILGAGDPGQAAQRLRCALRP